MIEMIIIKEVKKEIINKIIKREMNPLKEALIEEMKKDLVPIKLKIELNNLKYNMKK
jgi:hypothetical protein